MSGRIRANEKVHYVASTTFTLERIYSDLKMIGKGSYGVVCSALDLTTGSKVAIKKITPMAKDILDAKHVLREIRLMRHMGKHENIISLNDLMVREAADELYIVMELLDSDLHRVLQSPQILTQSHFRFFLHQLLCGVKYLHDNRIIHRSALPQSLPDQILSILYPLVPIHLFSCRQSPSPPLPCSFLLSRDLKPGNLLVSRDCKLRITDFGLARERPTVSPLLLL
jgi:serine/threonine protein kinase